MLKFKKKKDYQINLKNINSKSIINALNVMDNKPKTYNFSTLKNKRNKSSKNKVLMDVIDLKKSFGKGNHKKEVLKGVNLQIKENENIALLGANGAGKTVLVEILAGLNKPTSGEIKYLFEYTKTFQEKIGIQFQVSSYPPAITVKEILNFIIEIYGSNINQDEFYALIKIFDIESLYKSKASKLSGGQQQRLNVLLALIHKPKILFLDELSTGLDINIFKRIKNFIEEYATEHNISLVIVSHNMGEIQQLAKKIYFLKNGKVVFNEDIQKILKKWNSLEAFVEEKLI